MTDQNRNKNIETLRDMIKDVDFAMLTTLDADGMMRSRPMSTQEAEFDGDLWFITSVDTSKVSDIERNPKVHLSYAAPQKNRYISVTGTAEIVNDRAKIEEFWSPIYKIYFPDGKEDPKLRLLKVEVEKAEYWDGPNGLIPTIIGFAKALTGSADDMGENKKLNL